jgi:hypothetical protein
MPQVWPDRLWIITVLLVTLNSAMKLIFKLFVCLSIPFGLFMGLLIGADSDFTTGVYYGVREGVFFGFFMAVTLAWLQRRATRKYGEVTPVQSLRIETLASSMPLVFDKSVEALEQFGAQIKSQNESEGTIVARARASWKSFGELISIHIRQIGDANFEVIIESRPRFRGTIIDYGKGRENVEALAALLTKR